jgi:hypothetical protein
VARDTQSTRPRHHLTPRWSSSQLILVGIKISSFVSFVLNEVLGADLIADLLCGQGVHAGVLFFKLIICFPSFSSTPATANHCSEAGADMGHLSCMTYISVTTITVFSTEQNECLISTKLRLMAQRSN